MKKSVGLWIFALLVLLGVSLVTFLAGRDEQKAMPSASSVFPSGLAAFAELLRQEGFTVVIDRNESPNLSPNDLAIASVVIDADDKETDEEPADPTKTLKKMSKHLENGGRILELRFQTDFVTSTSQTSEKPVKWKVRNDSEYKVSVGQENWTGLQLASESPSLTLAATDTFTSVLISSKSASGVIASLLSGNCATNRFLDQAENASFMLDLVNRLHKKSGRIVFVEATIGNIDHRGLLSTLGPWAVVGQWQVIALILLVGYTLGKRFGPPVADVQYQRGTRQLVDALAEVFRRGKKAQYSARLVADDSLESVRMKLRLPPYATKPEILAASPPEIANLYNAVMAEVAAEGPSARLVTLVSQLQKATKSFVA